MPSLPGVDASAALAAAARAGPYFVVEPRPGGPAWRPLSVLVSDPAVLAERVGHARAVLARNAGTAPEEIQERVAASVVFLGLASRLVSPALGAAVLGGVVPDLTVDGLWWRPVEGGPLPLAARAVRGAAAGDLSAGPQLRAAAAALSQGCVQGLAGPVLAAFRTLFRVSPQVLWGNVASALAGAAGMLAGGFPARAQAAGQLTELVQPEAGRARRFLVRRSCCLLYRVPGGGTCGDCVLVPDEVRRQQWRAVLAAQPSAADQSADRH